MRTRVGALAVLLCAVVLAVVIATVTLSYEGSLDGALTSRLDAAAHAVLRSGSANTAKTIERGLALEGIATSVSHLSPPSSPKAGSAPVKAGTSSAVSAGVRTVTVTLTSGALVRFSASQSDVTRSVRNLLLLELAAAAGGLAVLLLLVRRATSITLRPLSRVVDIANAVAAGDKGRRVGDREVGGEVGALGAAFDHMVDALEQSADDARRSEESMRRFLADAAHELRTPVASIHALAERLLREQPERPQRDELEGALAARSRWLGLLIGNLLTLARLDGPAASEVAPVDLAELVHDVAAAASHDVGVAVEVQSERVVVAGERESLERLLRNLLDNSLALGTGAVVVSLRQTGEVAILTVRDWGPGVPASERARVFDRFVRLPGAPAGGSGLGLSIARDIARRHGGDLVCDDVDVGASFTATLPLVVHRIRLGEARRNPVIEHPAASRTGKPPVGTESAVVRETEAAPAEPCEPPTARPDGLGQRSVVVSTASRRPPHGVSSR